MARHNWLQAQIDQASKSVQLWPEWMKKVANFEGKGREDINAREADVNRAHAPSAQQSKPKQVKA